MGQKVKGNYVIGGVERVPERTVDTLMTVLRDWIEPGTTVITDCWSACRDMETLVYAHQTVNHMIGFVGVHIGAQRNTSQSNWWHVKAFLNPHNRMGD
jgi:hypothetical protein